MWLNCVLLYNSAYKSAFCEHKPIFILTHELYYLDYSHHLTGVQWWHYPIIIHQYLVHSDCSGCRPRYVISCCYSSRSLASKYAPSKSLLFVFFSALALQLRTSQEERSADCQASDSDCRGTESYPSANKLPSAASSHACTGEKVDAGDGRDSQDVLLHDEESNLRTLVMTRKKAPNTRLTTAGQYSLMRLSLIWNELEMVNQKTCLQAKHLNTF